MLSVQNTVKVTMPVTESKAKFEIISLFRTGVEKDHSSDPSLGDKVQGPST